MRFFKATALALILASAGFQISQAAPIPLTPDSSWQAWYEDEISQGDFFQVEYLLTVNSTIQITDYLVVTDRYEVFVNGTSIGASVFMPDWSELGGGDPFDYFEADPQRAFESNQFSTLVFEGAAGDLITVKLTHVPPMFLGGDPFLDSGFAIRAIALPDGGGNEVPEPATISLLSAGFAGLILLRRRK